MAAKIVKYYQVTTLQIMLFAIIVGIISGALNTINNSLIVYQQIPIVHIKDGKCSSVELFNNGESYTCEDVDIILRHYRKKIE